MQIENPITIQTESKDLSTINWNNHFNGIDTFERLLEKIQELGLSCYLAFNAFEMAETFDNETNSGDGVNLVIEGDTVQDTAKIFVTLRYMASFDKLNRAIHSIFDTP
jgi:hypothetical protein